MICEFCRCIAETSGKFRHDLLQVAINADGGLERRIQLKAVKASLSTTDVIWQLKGKPGVLIDIDA